MGYEINPKTGRQVRGFAGMDPERRKEIAAKGGGSVAPGNRSFARDRELASSAGRKGGENSKGGGRKHLKSSFNPEPSPAEQDDD